MRVVKVWRILWWLVGSSRTPRVLVVHAGCWPGEYICDPRGTIWICLETGIGGISALIRGGTERALIGTAPREFFCGNSILESGGDPDTDPGALILMSPILPGFMVMS